MHRSLSRIRSVHGLAILLTLHLLAWTQGALHAATLHVAPNGSDQNPGTSRQPLASPAGARDKIRSLGIAGKEAVTVEFRAGTYRLREPLVLRNEDSGSQKYPITFRAAKGAMVVWSGGVEVKGQWMAGSNGIQRIQVPQNIDSDQLFLNGRRQILARYPNFDPGQRILGGFSKDSASPSRVARWSNPVGGYLHAMHRHEWGDAHYRITRKNPDGTISMEGGWQNNRAEEGIHPAQRFVENIFEELDAPGEWFLDSRNGVLHLIPPATGTDLSRSIVELPVIRNIVEFSGTPSLPVRFVSIQGIQFKHTLRTFMENREPLLRSDWTTYRGGTILFNGAEDCAILDSTLDQVGGNGIYVNGYNRRVRIAGCEIDEAGASSILFVGLTNAVRSPLFNYHQTLPVSRLDLTPGPKTTDYPADCIVEDCLLTGNGRFEKQSAGVHIAMSSRITVRNCSIYNCPRAGINIGDGCWGGHVIEFCDIFDTVKETGDHGAFNSWGRDRYWVPSIKEVNKRVAENPGLHRLDAMEPVILRNNRWRCDHGWDIDLDDGSSNFVLENNLCLNGGIKLREGYERRVENNIMVNNSFHPHVWFTASGDIFRHNITMAGYYPIGMPAVWGKEIDSNLLPNEAALKRARELGTDQRSIAGEPEFLNAAQGNFLIKPGTAAPAIGFHNFPMDRFGVQKKQLRAKASTPLFTAQQAAKSSVSAMDAVESFWLGAKVKTITTLGERSAAGLSTESGVSFLQVPDGSVAAALGFRNRDVLLKAGATEIPGLKALRNFGGFATAGTRIPLVVQRDQRQVRFDALLPATLFLDAAAAGISGEFPLPNYDASRGYLGAWTSLNTRIEWKTKIQSPGQYKVWMEYACPEQSSGATFDVVCGKKTISSKVGATGGWEKFETREIGTIDLGQMPVGEAVLTLIPRSKPGQGIMNFRALHLIQSSAP